MGLLPRTCCPKYNRTALTENSVQSRIFHLKILAGSIKSVILKTHTNIFAASCAEGGACAMGVPPKQNVVWI
jgi:hypothetical protein